MIAMSSTAVSLLGSMAVVEVGVGVVTGVVEMEAVGVVVVVIVEVVVGWLSRLVQEFGVRPLPLVSLTRRVNLQLPFKLLWGRVLTSLVSNQAPFVEAGCRTV